jgi:hypothetical protein
VNLPTLTGLDRVCELRSGFVKRLADSPREIPLGPDLPHVEEPAPCLALTESKRALGREHPVHERPPLVTIAGPRAEPVPERAAKAPLNVLLEDLTEVVGELLPVASL